MPVSVNCAASTTFSGQKGRKLFIPVKITLADFVSPAGGLVLRITPGVATPAAFSLPVVAGWSTSGGGGVEIAVPPGVASFDVDALPLFEDNTLPNSSSNYAATYRVEVFQNAASQGSTSFSLSGSAVPAKGKSVVFVLDRSSSMATGAPGNTRLERLKSSVPACLALFRDDIDELGLAVFGNKGNPVSTINLAPAGTTRSQVAQACADLTIDKTGPFGKSLQKGINAGRGLDPNATVLLVTDGQNSNTASPPLNSAQTPEAAALVLGDEHAASPSYASQLVSSLDRYQYADPSTFLGDFGAEKLLTQLLLDLSNLQFVVDPDGTLKPGAALSFPVPFCQADRELQLILFSEQVDALDVRLVPKGSRPEPPRSQETCYPDDSKTPKSASRSLVQRVSTKGLLQEEVGEVVVQVSHRAENSSDKPVRFSLLISAETDLLLKGGVTAAGHTVGSDLLFSAFLTEYGLPVFGRDGLSVVVELRHPDGGVETIELSPKSPGRFEAARRTFSAGVYSAHFIAEGPSMHIDTRHSSHVPPGSLKEQKARPFRRECVRTVAVFQAVPPCPCSTRDTE